MQEKLEKKEFSRQFVVGVIHWIQIKLLTTAVVIHFRLSKDLFRNGRNTQFARILTEWTENPSHLQTYMKMLNNL